MVFCEHLIVTLAMQKHVVALVVGLSSAVIVAGGCDRQPASLRERVQAYWEARIQGDAQRAYSFESSDAPDQGTYTMFLLRSPVTYRSYTIASVQEQEQEAVVELRMEYVLPDLSRPVTSSLTEKWVKVRGQWYRQWPAAESSTSRQQGRG